MAEEISNQEKILETETKDKPPFRLRFAHTLDIGRSALSLPELPGFHEPLTSKYYSAYDTSKLAESKDVGHIQEEISKLRLSGPRQKYQEPILESHKYGWFQKKLIQLNPETERVHFPKRNSEMVRVQNLLDNAARADQLYYMLKRVK